MPKLEDGINGSFKVNGIPYQKGLYEPVINNSLFGIRRVGTKGADDDMIARLQKYTDWTDVNDNSFANIQQLITYIEGFFFVV